MKFPENADITEYTKAIKVGAIKGALVGLAAGGTAALYLRRKTSFFTGAGGFQRMLVFAAPPAFCTIVSMELSSRDFEQHMRLKQHGQLDQETPHRSASLWDSSYNFVVDNKYKFVVAGWAASLAGSFHLVNRDPYMTKAQKIVQARVYAQGLTVALLLATVALSVTEPKDDKQKAEEQSHSWERDLKYLNVPRYASDEKDTSLLQRFALEDTEPGVEKIKERLEILDDNDKNSASSEKSSDKSDKTEKPAGKNAAEASTPPAHDQPPSKK